MLNAIQFDMIASSSDPRTSKIIAIGVENAEHVPVIVPDHEISTVLSQGLSANVSSTSVLPCAKKHKTSKPQKRGLDLYFDYVSEKDKIRFDESVAKFFYGCNIPFDKVESKVFLDCMRTIRPGYKPLSAAAMANQFLHDSHAQLEKMRSTLSNSEGVLILFRTETEQELHVVAFVQSQDKKNIYLKTWYAQKNDNFIDIIHDAIDLSRTKFNITIYAAISDENLGSIDLNRCRTLWSLQCHKSFAASVEVDLVDFELTENVRYLLDEFSSTELQESLIVHGGTDIKLRDSSHSHYWSLFSSCMKNYGAMR